MYEVEGINVMTGRREVVSGSRFFINRLYGSFHIKDGCRLLHVNSFKVQGLVDSADSFLSQMLI